MSQPENSGAPKFALPAELPSSPGSETLLVLDAVGRSGEHPQDLVELLCICQRRYREVQVERNEELYAVTEVAYFLGLELQGDRDALLHLIQQPLFQQRARPPKPHHQLKPVLLAVQFLLSAHTLNEQKRASCIGRALQGLVGDHPQPGDVRNVLRRYGYDNLARAHAKSQRNGKKDEADFILRFSAEARGAVGRILEAVPVGQQIWILAEHVPAKRGRCQLQLIATAPLDPNA